MVELYDGFFPVENLEYLLFIGLGIFDDFLARQLFTRFRLSRGISDHAGEVTDQKNNLMTEILKLFHLLDQHRVTQVEVRRRGVEPGLNPSRPSSLELTNEVCLRQDLDYTPFDQVKLCMNIRHDLR